MQLNINKILIKKFILMPLLAGLALLLIAKALSFYEDYDNVKYKKGFLSISKVKAIEGYMDYEGTKSVTLILKDSKKISLADFDMSIFTKTDKIWSNEAFGLELVCRMDKNDPTSSIGVNVISFVKSSPLKIKIENVKDLVENYDIIYNYLLTFPTNPENAKVVNMDNRVDKNKDHWCFVKKSGTIGDRPRLISKQLGTDHD